MHGWYGIFVFYVIMFSLYRAGIAVERNLNAAAFSELKHRMTQAMFDTFDSYMEEKGLSYSEVVDFGKFRKKLLTDASHMLVTGVVIGQDRTVRSAIEVAESALDIQPRSVLMNSSSRTTGRAFVLFDQCHHSRVPVGADWTKTFGSEKRLLGRLPDVDDTVWTRGVFGNVTQSGCALQHLHGSQLSRFLSKTQVERYELLLPWSMICQRDLDQGFDLLVLSHHRGKTIVKEFLGLRGYFPNKPYSEFHPELRRVLPVSDPRWSFLTPSGGDQVEVFQDKEGYVSP